MESDDEWVTELEDPCLSVDNSWMDIHKCFEHEEGTSKKRKRGPRNLQADKKGKAKVHEVESVVIEDDDDEKEEEHEGGEEGEEVMEFLDEDGGFQGNDEFIDIDINDD